MRLLSKSLVFLALLFVATSGTPAGIAAELTLELIDARLKILRDGDTPETDETLRAYESARTRLNDATSYERDAANYVDALTNGRTREAEIQARIDALVATDDVPLELDSVSYEELEAQLRLSRTELRAATTLRNSDERRLAARETNENSIRTRLEEIARRLPEIDELEVSIDPTASPSMTEASQWNSAAEQIALVSEQRALEARLASQPVRYSALRAERAELTLRIEKLTRQVRTLGEGLRSSQLEVTEPEDLGIEIDNPVRPIADQLTTDNAQLRGQRLDIETRLEAVNLQGGEVERSMRALGDRFATARRMVDFASDSDVLGRVLLAYWEGIESFRLTPTIQFSVEVGDTVISRIAHEEALGDLLSASGYITGQISAAGLDPATVPEASRDTLVDLARSKGQQLRRLIGVESDYLYALSELETNHTRLANTIDEYEEYLAVLILWEPSRLGLWKTNFRTIPSEVGQILDDLRETRVAIQPSFPVLLLIVGILLLIRKRIHNVQLVQNARILRPGEDSMGLSFVALLLTGVRASTAPLLLVAVGTLFSGDTAPVAAMLSTAIDFLIVVLFVLTFIHTLCEKSGVSETHFEWRPETCKLLYRETGWLIRWWFPIAVFASFAFMLAADTAVIGRLALLLAIVVLIGHLASSCWRDMRISGRHLLSIKRNRLRLLLVAMLIVLVAGVVWGLRYSVGLITRSLLVTLVAGICLLLLHDLLMRWLRVVQRRLRVSELLAAQTERITGETSSIEQDQEHLIEISEDTTQLLNVAALTCAGFLLLYIWTPLLPAFNVLSNVSLWSSAAVVEGESALVQITLETLVVVVVLLGITIYAARKLPALIELVLRARTHMTAGARYTTSTLTSYVIVGVGVVSALSALGLEWSKLQWLVAALGVGIGFGLQEIVANFISGLIILFERPIRVGDVVTVGDKDGEVRKIRIRATTIRDWDGRELLVPNKEFITGQLLNWSLSDSNMRILIEVGVAYGSDVEQALTILNEVVADHPRTLEDPRPVIMFENFGDNALELSIRCFLGEYHGWQEIVTELRREIYLRFNAAGIVIAFPQRDVHFDSEQPLRVVVDSPSGQLPVRPVNRRPGADSEVTS